MLARYAPKTPGLAAAAAGLLDAKGADRVQVLEAVGRLGLKDQVPALEKAGKDADPFVRAAAGLALCRIDKSRAAAAVAALAGLLKDGSVRDGRLVPLVLDALAALGADAAPHAAALVEGWAGADSSAAQQSPRPCTARPKAFAKLGD